MRRHIDRHGFPGGVPKSANEERDIISQFIARVGGGQEQASFARLGARDHDARRCRRSTPRPDRLIRRPVQPYPEARCRISQLAFVQEHALAEAQNRLQRMEWELQQAQQRAQQAPQQQQGSGSGGGFFSGLFGGGARSAPPPQQGAPAWNQGGPQQGYQQAPPPPQYAPSYQPGMFQRPGSGFLGSALTTAGSRRGMGGLVAGNALMNLFSGSHGGGFGGGGNSPWGGSPAGIEQSPWGGGTPADQGQGTWTDNSGGGQTDPGYVDNGSWDNSSSDQSSSLDVQQQRCARIH